MNFKKKLGMGVASGALGLALIGGGTFAFFSDKAETNNTFAAGTLDLSVDPEVLVELDNLKPGDTMRREFLLKNDGTLPIKSVELATSYEVVDANNNNNNGEDLGEHIVVNFFWNWDKQAEPVYSKTLAELKDMTPDAVAKDLFSPEWGEESGLEAGTDDYLWVEFEFVDNGNEQNQFQGDQLKLKWEFNAIQTEGEEK